jgi:2OG-Fe(II) oxygenase superfamily
VFDRNCAIYNIAMTWKKYRYYDVFRGIFTAAECDRVIALHCHGDRTRSELHDSSGEVLRISDLFWLRRLDDTAWIFDRVRSVVLQFNKNYGFELVEQVSAAQLTRYTPNQHYGWHMDLGAGESSLRKLSAVVELSSPASRTGGGLGIFYGDKIDNRVPLDIGDVAVFPSYLMHKAFPVESGIRWSLVLWFTGPAPFR